MMRYLRCGSSRLPTFANGLMGSKRELVGREEQHRAGDGRLAHRGLVEVLDRAHLRPRHLPLEGGVGPLDLRDEVRHVVVAFGFFGRDGSFALGVEARDEAHLVEQVLGGIGGEVEDAVLLAYLRGEHGRWVNPCTRVLEWRD